MLYARGGGKLQYLDKNVDIFGIISKAFCGVCTIIIYYQNIRIFLHIVLPKAKQSSNCF